MCHFSPLHLLVLAIVQKKDLSAMRLVTFCTSRWRNTLVTVNFKKRFLLTLVPAKQKIKLLVMLFAASFQSLLKGIKMYSKNSSHSIDGS